MEPEAQGRGSTFTLCHALLKKAILHHTEAGVRFSLSICVCIGCSIYRRHCNHWLQGLNFILIFLWDTDFFIKKLLLQKLRIFLEIQVSQIYYLQLLESLINWKMYQKSSPVFYKVGTLCIRKRKYIQNVIFTLT